MRYRRHRKSKKVDEEIREMLVENMKQGMKLDEDQEKVFG